MKKEKKRPGLRPSLKDSDSFHSFFRIQSRDFSRYIRTAKTERDGRIETNLYFGYGTISIFVAEASKDVNSYQLHTRVFFFFPQEDIVEHTHTFHNTPEPFGYMDGYSLYIAFTHYSDAGYLGGLIASLSKVGLIRRVEPSLYHIVEYG